VNVSSRCNLSISQFIFHYFSKLSVFSAAAINPTYEYGKHANQQPLARAVRQDSPAASGAAAEHQPHTVKSSFADRGHKATILFNSLPDTPETLSDQEENGRRST